MPEEVTLTLEAAVELPDADLEKVKNDDLRKVLGDGGVDHKDAKTKKDLIALVRGEGGSATVSSPDGEGDDGVADDGEGEGDDPTGEDGGAVAPLPGVVPDDGKHAPGDPYVRGTPESTPHATLEPGKEHKTNPTTVPPPVVSTDALPNEEVQAAGKVAYFKARYNGKPLTLRHRTSGPMPGEVEHIKITAKKAVKITDPSLITMLRGDAFVVECTSSGKVL